MTDLHIIESEIGPVIPISDICERVGYSRSGATHLLRRHASSFVGLTVTASIRTPAGARLNLCLTKDGVDRFIALLNPSEVTRPGLAERVRQFRAEVFGESRTALTKLSTVDSSGNGKHGADNLSDVLTEYGKRAQVLSREWGVDPAVARKVMMADAVERFPELISCRALVGDTAVPAALLAPAHEDLPKADTDYDRFFGIRDVAKFCQCQENQARKILVDEGVLAYQNDHVILTRFGERFGKVFVHYPEYPHRMTEKKMIRYNPNAVQLVRGKLSEIQTHLPQQKSITE